MNMRHWIFTSALVALALTLWMLMTRLSSDASAMAVGLLFGVIAGVPTALLVLVGGKQRQAERNTDDYRQPQPPVIVLAAPREERPQVVNYNMYVGDRTEASEAAALARRYAESLQPQRRVFRVVGEREVYQPQDK